MENEEQIAALYIQQILPFMPAYTSITQEKGVEILAQLMQTNFDAKYPHWKFTHALTWMKTYSRDADVQVDIAILKRYIAAIIDKADKNNDLQELKKDILENKDSLRWVILADVNSSVSNERIKDRWSQFMSTISESIPMKLNA